MLIIHGDLHRARQTSVRLEGWLRSNRCEWVKHATIFVALVETRMKTSEASQCAVRNICDRRKKTSQAARIETRGSV